MPPAASSEGPVAVVMNDIDLGVTYNYDDSNEIRISLSKTDFSVLGEQAIKITFTDLITGDIQILIQDELFGSFSLNNEDSLDFPTPPHAAGKGLKFKVFIENIGFTNSINVRYRLTVASVTPAASSTTGGALLTISGHGFGWKQVRLNIFLIDLKCQNSQLDLLIDFLTLKLNRLFSGVKKPLLRS